MENYITPRTSNPPSLKHNTTVKPDLPIFGVPEYANGYDLVIHDECAAGITDVAGIEGVLFPHKATK